MAKTVEEIAGEIVAAMVQGDSRYLSFDETNAAFCRKSVAELYKAVHAAVRECLKGKHSKEE